VKKNSASTSTPLCLPRPRCHDPDDLDLEVLPLLRPDAEGLEHSVVPVLLRRHAGRDHLGGLDDQDVLRAEGEHRFGVTARVGLEGLADQVDVLFGHGLG
jgi:hypothetical protein